MDKLLLLLMTKNLSQAELKALDGLFNICIRSGTVSHADLVDSMYGRGASALAKALANFGNALDELDPNGRSVTAVQALLKGLSQELQEELESTTGRPWC